MFMLFTLGILGAYVTEFPIFPTASSIAHSPHDQREDEVLRFHFVYGKQECEWFGFHKV